MPSAWRQREVLSLLVLFDTAGKVLAFRVLPTGQPVHQCLLCLILRVNTLGLGTIAGSLVGSHGLRAIRDSLVFAAVLAVLLLILAFAKRLRKRWVIVAIFATIGTTVVVSALLPLGDSSPSPALIASSRAAATGLWLVVWALSTSKFWKAGALFFSAAGVSNLFSYAYHPFRVVDYFWSTPLNNWIGMGVFNLADFFWLIGIGIFGFAFCVTVWNHVQGWLNGRAGARV